MHEMIGSIFKYTFLKLQYITGLYTYKLMANSNYRLKMLSICFHKYEDEGTVEGLDKDNSRVRKTCKSRGMLSESTLSTSSTVCQFHCSELESLARPPSPSLPPSPLSTLLH